MKKIILIVFFLFVVRLTLNAQGWVPVGTGFDGDVNSLAVYNGVLYAGGAFDTASFQYTGGFAYWWAAAQSWQMPLTGPVNGTVYSMLVYNTDLIVAGYFGMAGDNITSWNGTLYNSPFNQGLWSFSGNSYGHALAVYNGLLYAAGDFDWADYVPVQNITSWNGNVFSPLGLGIAGDAYAMAVYNGELYASGLIVSPGNSIAKWNGTTWSTVGTGMASSNPVALVAALAVYNGELYAGGLFTTAGGNPVNNIAKWNGTNWSDVGGGINGRVDALIVYNSELYAGGWFSSAGGSPANTVAKWNGTAWAAVGSGMNDWVNTFAVFNNELYAGGKFTIADGNPANRIVKWDTSFTSGVSEKFIEQKVFLFPNPAITGVTINFDKAMLYNVQLTNTLGESLEQIQINSSSHTLDMSSRPRGIYFVTVRDEAGNKTVKKIVKM